jgi:hypothetical protein
MRTISDIVRAKKLKSSYNARLHADVAKLVDAPDLGSGVEIREGSSPFIRTTIPMPRCLSLAGLSSFTKPPPKQRHTCVRYRQL